MVYYFLLLCPTTWVDNYIMIIIIIIIITIIQIANANNVSECSVLWAKVESK